MKTTRPARLVVVACHAVFAGGEAVGGYPGEASCYLEHARAGVELAETENCLLLFSGGATQQACGVRSEAESYLEEANRHDWWGHADVALRAATEDYARDSMENLLFFLHRFRQLAGGNPVFVTVAGWHFKEHRFQLHREAIGWPAAGFRYHGVNNPPAETLPTALAGEQALVGAVLADPHLQGPAFAAKRARRDPFGRGCPYRLGPPAPW